MSYRKTVNLGSKEKKDRQYINFPVFKKNKWGDFQRRMIQIDVTNNVLRNIKNFRETEKRRFKFADLKLALPDDQNPLECAIEFNNHPPFNCYLYNVTQRNELCRLINQIIKNTSDKKDTQLNISENLLKEGGADYKKKTIGYDRRYLYLYPLCLHCFSQDNSDISRHMISLFSTAISKEDEKSIAIHSRLQKYLFRFDTAEQRDDWFEALIKASHNEGVEWEALSEDVNFAEDYKNVKKGEEEMASKIRSVITQKSALAHEKDVLSRDLESIKTTRKALVADISRIGEEKNKLEQQKIDAANRLSEVKTLVEKAQREKNDADAAKDKVQSSYKAAHDVFLVVQANFNAINAELAVANQEYSQHEATLRQLDATIIDMQKSPELIASQNAQTQRDIDNTTEKLKASEAEVTDITQNKLPDVATRTTSAQQRKEDALKMLEAARESLANAKKEKETLDANLAQSRQQVEHAIEKGSAIQKEIQQLQSLTTATNAQIESIRKEISVLA